MTRLIVFILAAAGLFAQTHVAISTQTSVTSDKLTLQHSPSNPTRIQACAFVAQSTVDGTVKIEVGGTAPTSTAATRSPISPGGSSAKALAYSASDVGTGTTISILYKLTANVPLTINLKGIRLAGPGTTRNVTGVIALGSAGNVSSSIFWSEEGLQCAN